MDQGRWNKIEYIPTTYSSAFPTLVTQVTNHNMGCRIWPSLAQHSITQVMIYNLGYDL